VWVLVAVVVALAAPASVAFGRSSPRTPTLTAAITRAMGEAAIPGAIVGVRRSHAAPYVKVFGVRDTATGQPMSTRLYMRVGSVTKTFTVTAVLPLVDQGKVGLDDPIGRYVSGVPNGNAITLRELAEMRSGLFDYLEDEDFVRPWLTEPMRHWTPRQLLAFGIGKPVLFAPGTNYKYTNTNTMLLGLVMEKVSHQRRPATGATSTR
jgi:D-alanyl-D-alanine carboxypeptidase